MERATSREDKNPPGLPDSAERFIAAVVRKMRYRRRARDEVREELTAHFEDDLKDCTSEVEREQRAKRLIEEFGDAELLAVLCRRAKKRCRPLWKKALVRFMQVSGVFILYVVICMLPLYLGKATIKTDYLSWLNETVRAGREEPDNARPHYDKAVKLYAEMPEWLKVSSIRWPGDMNDIERQSLSDWLDQNAAALDAVREGSMRPYCWANYRSKPLPLPQGMAAMPETVFAGIVDDCGDLLSAYRQLAYALQWRVCLDAFKGEVDVAVTDCLVLARFADHFVGRGLSIEQILGLGIGSMADDSILGLLDCLNVAPAFLVPVLDRWQERLDRLGTGVSFDAEKGIWSDRIQWSFTDDGKGDGHALARGVAYWMSGYGDFWRVLTLRCPTRQEAVADIEAYYSHLNGLLTEFPWQWHRQDVDANDPAEAMVESFRLMVQNPRKFRLANLFLQMQSEADRVMVEMSWQRRTKLMAVLTILALERYRMEEGQYPADLKQVVDAGYLPRVLRDPFGPGPLSYARTDSGFTLYSWGKDRKDDGGHRGEDKDTGDWVFWPVTP